MTNTASLETFDFLQLLYLLSGQGRTGVLTVHRADGPFQAFLEGERVRHLQFAAQTGLPALLRLLRDPQGRFQFDEGVRHPNPLLNTILDEVALEVLDSLPEVPLPFSGPVKITSPERVARIPWGLKEQEILKQIEVQRPVSVLSQDPDARWLLQKLHQIQLIAPRKSRVARLSVAVTREVRGVVVVDDLILRRWREDMLRPPQHIAVRTDDGQVHTLPVRGGPNLSNALLVPPELLMRTGLGVGDSVLVRPA
ncbi:DUF4388 domain-containing protein [Deinococcus radiopugnans]|uniref:DUF4388 domain-containing protein n=1 Tax=Deinococcus radiopugnans ATCC 19172 TaxID=585398 RepID=A0A5C4Y9B9_9DEIO|nr:DUF4388 domain-containing protein [Deinococcus radiopugnans]MBB6014922.1 hypothetical protein [Deinococcus radiopugnans ATCC 19172]QLG10212.1 DUF4388 domain-containing protein [Deinococcus sp. D7000]TNM71662.1 DUF4388 domain-containing protein [Deinococcus radiopugnans ATCC 19172]